jgi:hypothetical protein
MPDYPRIFSVLLDAVAAGMRLRPTVKLAELEQMADFTRWGEAAAQGAGWAPGTFVTAYRANRQAVSSVTLEDSPMAQAMLSLAKIHGPWKGTPSQLPKLIAGYTFQDWCCKLLLCRCLGCFALVHVGDDAVLGV